MLNIDVPSFIDFYLINELRNIDDIDWIHLCIKIRTQMEENYNGPLWDYNLAFGNAEYCSGWNTVMATDGLF